MKVRLKGVENGANSNEKIVEISTSKGSAFLAVDSSQIQENKLDVGGPVAVGTDKYLVELPQETFGGAWRVWVAKSELEGLETAS
jgi:hypothetical protein